MNGKRPGGWVALAWRYYRDPKFDDLSADAERLWCRALAYCGEQETDGRVASTVLVALSQRLVGSPEAAAGELVATGLWHEVERGYVVNAWDRWQPTAEQARAGRERDAKRKARSRANADSMRDNPEDSREESRRAGAGAGAGAGHSPTAHDPLTPTRERERNTSDDQPRPLALAEWVDERGYLWAGADPRQDP